MHNFHFPRQKRFSSVFSLLRQYSFLLSLLGAALLVGTALFLRSRHVSPVPRAVSAAVMTQSPHPSVSPSPTPPPVCAPLSGSVLTDHQPDSLIWSDTLQQYTTHPGMDISAALGTVVCAMLDGTICSAYEDARLGYVVEIRHEDGLLTRYANLMGLQMVQVGQRICAGDIIGSVGASAAVEQNMPSHLHLEAEKNGHQMDPALLLGK